MKKTTLLCTFLFLLLQVNISMAAAPKVGEKAPQLKLTGLLQAPGKLEQNIKSLEGKVVVLEFWATWCAPCIAAMPHLNELSGKYKSKGVQFISITDETDAKAKDFLKKRKINGWVGIDGDKAMHTAYEVQGIPFTVVIGADGRVLGYPVSKLLSEEMLDQALAGQELVTAMTFRKDAGKTSATVAEPAAALYELSIRPSVSKGMSNAMMPNQYRTKGAAALDVIKIAFDAADKHTVVTAQLPDGGFDVVAMSPAKSSPSWAWRPPLQQMVVNVWGLQVQPEQREMEVYELATTSAAKKRLVPGEPKAKFSQQSSDSGVLAGRNTSMATLVRNLQGAMGAPVLDATGLSGTYDYNLYYDEGNPQTLIKSLESELGLQLRKVSRMVDVLVIAPKE